MRKIYRVRHIENMIQLSRRAARNAKTEEGRRNSKVWVKRYTNLLNVVRDASEVPEA